ncbi:efflux RND transporter periplasmic adaptor subunit [bacterium]|nr:efflux RND transporter periplasmic adaptor subunit [bacterium]
MAGQRMHGLKGRPHHGMTPGTGVIILLVAALCAASIGFGCGKKKDAASTEKITNVKIWIAEKRSVRPYIETIGSLNPDEEVVISSEVDGILKDIRVDEGSPAAKGTMLARIDDTDYRLGKENAEASLRQAEANLANLRVEHARKEALLKEELVTKQQFDDISTRLSIAVQDLDRAKVALSLARQRLGKTAISSPIKGVVKEKKVAAGDFVRAGMPLLSIVGMDPLKLSFTVTEKDVGRLKTGQDVTFSVDTFPGREFYGKLTSIYPSLDERTRSLRAEALVENPGTELKPGFFAKVRVFTGASRQSVVIPLTSVLYEGTSIRVFLKDKDKAKARFLKLGNKYGDMVEVLDGLQGGESLIVVGQNNLTEGVKINVVK